MLMTTHCAPNRSADSVRTSGRDTAAELMLTLSAPARSARPTSSAERTPAANGQRYEESLGRSAGDVEQRATLFCTGGDVEKDDLVGTLALITRREFYWVAYGRAD
jgi:hypothetical protein